MPDEINDKIKSILGDPESLSKIAGAMSALGYGTNDSTGNDIKNDAEQAETELLPRLAASKTDDRIKLLASIRPFLEPTKQQKVDSLIKALGAAKIISKYKGEDIFGLFGTR